MNTSNMALFEQLYSSPSDRTTREEKKKT